MKELQSVRNAQIMLQNLQGSLSRWLSEFLVSQIFGSLPSTVPAGSLAKAASEGAKTVNGPLPLRVSTRPAALTAAVIELRKDGSVLWLLIASNFEWIWCC
jgi:hypothetical protein